MHMLFEGLRGYGNMVKFPLCARARARVRVRYDSNVLIMIITATGM